LNLILGIIISEDEQAKSFIGGDERRFFLVLLKEKKD
jgi:hypothetical protein